MNTRSFLVAALLGLLIGACSDDSSAPQGNNPPSIELVNVEFQKIGTNSDKDSLIVTLNFNDPDGDLGLRTEELDSPYHKQSFFLDKNGRLITIRTKYNELEAGDEIPRFIRPYNCLNYLYTELYIPEGQEATFDPTYAVPVEKNGKKYYAVRDTFYIEQNTNHYNITVEFQTKNADGTFQTFDWRTVYDYPVCGEIFDGRFPLQNKREGTLRYVMTSNGFLPLLGSKTMKLRIQIKDRALNVSNVVESSEFTFM